MARVESKNYMRTLSMKVVSCPPDFHVETEALIFFNQN